MKKEQLQKQAETERAKLDRCEEMIQYYLNKATTRKKNGDFGGEWIALVHCLDFCRFAEKTADNYDDIAF